MHPSLARQLRRLGLESPEQLAQVLQELHEGAPTPELAAFVNGLAALFERVNSTYEQNDRDLALRSRSLELSSAELSGINDKMRDDIASRNRVLQSVRDAAGKLLEHSQQTFCIPLADDLEGHSALLMALIEQQEQRRLELANQRFAMDQHAIVCITDTQGNIRYVNDRFCQISGYSRDDLVGKNNRILRSQQHNKFFFENFWRTISRGGVWRGEICNLNKNHQLYWVDATIVPFLDERGKPYQYIGILTDISNSKRMASKIIASEQKYRFLVENLRDVIFQLDGQGNFLFLNPAWHQLTGFRLAESLGRSYLDFSHPEDRDKASTIFKLLTKHEIEASKYEQRFFDNTGNLRWFEVRIQAEIDVNTGRKIYTGTMTDITERRRIEQLQSEFISVVSHELRTPLTSIRGSLGLLESGQVGELMEPQQRLVHIAHKNSQRLVTLVNDILDMEKLMAGKMGLKSETIELVSFVEFALETNAAYAQAHQVKFELRDSPADVLVNADTDRLMQVMANLLSNAAKFSPPERAVEIDITREQHYAKVSVRDFGPGIPTAFQSRIFSAFAQADSSDTRQQGGTGLGLKISKTLIEKMGGTIGFDPTIEQGTCFWFRLPLVA